MEEFVASSGFAPDSAQKSGT